MRGAGAGVAIFGALVAAAVALRGTREEAVELQGPTSEGTVATPYDAIVARADAEASGPAWDAVERQGPVPVPSSRDPAAAAAAMVSETRAERRRAPRYERGFVCGRASASCVSGCGGPGSAEELVVQYQDGSPVAGAVVATTTDGDIRAAADQAGCVRSRAALLAWWRDEAEIRLEGRRLHRRGEEWLPGLRRRVVVWAAGRTVHGEVVDPAGSPLPGARLRLWRDRGFDVRTDASGRFLLEDASPGTIEVRAEDEGLLPFPSPDAIPELEDETRVRLVAYPARTVRVAVAAPPGASDLCVESRYLDPTNPTRVRASHSRVGPDGTAVARLAPDQDLDVTAWGRRGTDARRLVALADALPDVVPIRLRGKDEDLKTWIPIRCRLRHSGEDLRPEVVLARPLDRPWEVARAVPHRSSGCCDGSREGAVTWEADGDSWSGTLDADFDVLDVYDLEPGGVELFLWQPGCAPVIVSGQVTAEGIYPPPEAWFERSACKLVVELVGPRGWICQASGTVSIVPLRGQGPFLHPLTEDGAPFRAALPGHLEIVAGRGRLALPPGRYRVEVTPARGAATVAEVTLPGPPLVVTTSG